MKVKWFADDGYDSGDRPQYVEVDDDEIAECETIEDLEELINEYVADAFNQTISYSFSVPSKLLKRFGG